MEPALSEGIVVATAEPYLRSARSAETREEEAFGAVRSRTAARELRESTGAVAETYVDRQSTIVISTDLADAERVLDVQDALASGLETEALPVASSAAGRLDGAIAMRVAPHASTRRRTARYRIPRQEKRRLLDRFCGLTDTDAAPRTLLIVAHPDDESIGAGARLAELGEAWVTYVTDGAPRNVEVARRYGFETREAYSEQRQKEARAALAIAGVSEERIGCLHIVDGEATLNLVELCLRIADLIDTLRPNVIVTHPYEGGHTDHDATAFAVHLACGVLRREGVKPPAVFEMTSYNAVTGERVCQQFLPHTRADMDQRLVELDADEQDMKARMYACFETQQSVLKDFDTRLEKFRPAPRYVFTRPPHGGVLNYERYGDPDLGRRFRDGAEEALRQLRVRRSS